MKPDNKSSEPKYVVGPIQSFVNEDNERCETPVVLEASDGRSYIKVILTSECPDGVEDFSDGECYSIFADEAKLLKLVVNKPIRVSAK